MSGFTPEHLALIAEGVREQRNQLLVDNVDKFNGVRWAALSPELQQQWSAYRQQLLDISDQPGFPVTVIWPIKPDEIWN